MSETAINKQMVQFYFFWQWEYQRRNEQYIKDFDELVVAVKKNLKKSEVDVNLLFAEVKLAAINKIRALSKTPGANPTLKEIEDHINKSVLKKIKDFLKKYYQADEPRNPRAGASSTEIFKKIATGKSYIDEATADKYTIDQAQLLLPMSGVKVVSAPGNDTDPNRKFTVEIDPLTPTKSILAAVNYYCGRYSFFFKKSSYEDDLYKTLAAIIESIGFQNFRTTADFARAKGLWMWDYMQENNLQNNQKPLSRVCNEVTALEERIKNIKIRKESKLQDSSDDDKLTTDKTLSRYLNNTTKMIKDMQVYPIADDK